MGGYYFYEKFIENLFYIVYGIEYCRYIIDNKHMDIIWFKFKIVDVGCYRVC
jgi:hypothetical protein